MLAGNIPVKHEYSQGAFAAAAACAHTAGMQNLRRIRNERGLTQQQLAEKAGVSQGMLSRMEAGTANPTLDIIEAVAGALDVPPPLLFGMPEFQAEAWKALNQISPEIQPSALLLLRKLASE